jgi:hypothetical protein
VGQRGEPRTGQAMNKDELYTEDEPGKRKWKPGHGPWELCPECGEPLDFDNAIRCVISRGNFTKKSKLRRSMVGYYHRDCADRYLWPALVAPSPEGR